MSLKDLVPWRKGPAEEATVHPIAAMQREMNQMFNRMWAGEQMAWPTWAGMGEEFGSFVPNVEVSETDKMVQLSAELPGMSEEDIAVTLSPDATMMTIKGEKKYEKEEKEKDFHRTERAYGSFRRTVPLPCPVNPSSVEAVFKKGVLDVRLQKADPQTTGVKQIKVTSG